MGFKVIVTLRARRDAREALNHYDLIRPELGDQFMTDMLDRLNAIAENPYAYSFSNDKRVLRDVAFDGFPYLVVYKVVLNRVTIVSIHCRYKKPIF